MADGEERPRRVPIVCIQNPSQREDRTLDPPKPSELVSLHQISPNISKNPNHKKRDDVPARKTSTRARGKAPLSTEKPKLPIKLTVKSKNVKHTKSPIPTCPICSFVLAAMSEQEISLHVDMCLSKQEQMESDESFAEYEIGGEKRISVAALHGALSGSATQPKPRPQRDVEDDLNIEEEEAGYGTVQYTEKDLKGKRLKPDPIYPEPQRSDPQPAAQDEETTDPNLIVQVLKSKIREQQEQLTNVVKCLICMEPYQTPVVSTVCWHVYCESCWLQTLAVKKLCPQCNVITSPTELRRIYL